MNFSGKMTSSLLALCTAFSAVAVGASGAEHDVNIISGLPYTIETGAEIAHSYALAGNETPASEGKLTDGKRASVAFGDSAWHKFYRGYTRSITFALPEAKAVTGFSLSIVQLAEAGLPMPPSFDMYISENGEDYMLAGSFDASCFYGVKGNQVKRTVKLENVGPYLANYVRIEFRCEVNVFMDEIEVYGHDPRGDELPFEKTPEREYINAYDAGIDGCREMVLLYCGYKGKYTEEYVNNTYERLLPYFGHINSDGKIDDTFFDSFLFSQLGGVGPSGGSLDPNGKIQAVKSDWEYFLNNIFDEEYNCGAIERVMDEVKAATGQTDATVSLVINVPYPHLGAAAFGDINGDGKDEYCKSEDDQLAIYEWFFNEVEKKFAERGYKNITFGGYYWWLEGVATENGQPNDELTRKVADIVHAHNTSFLWIPYLYGNGFDRVRELGFDCAMMQPNYAFLDYADDMCFTEINNEILKHGLGIEIEVKWTATSDDEALQRYYTYLNAGHALGYEYGVAHSYYQNANPGTYYNFAKSSNIKYRNAYDDTYLFVKGKYQPRDVVLVNTSSVTKVDCNSSGRGVINIKSDTSPVSLGNWKWAVTQAPEHGTVTLRDNGVYIYRPEQDYVGDDEFVVQLVAEYATSLPITVNVSVSGPDGEGNSSETVDETSLGEESSVSEGASALESKAEEPTVGDKKGSALPFVAAGAAVAAAAGVAIAAIGRRKKKKSQ